MLGCGSMKEETVEEFRKKHFENYKNAVMETLKNNTTVLFKDDIYSLLQKPPLDSMDLIKCKFLELAKKYKIIIQADSLNRILKDYREDVISNLSCWQKIRIVELSKIVNSFLQKKESDVIKFNKKDFIPINRKLKKQMKTDIIKSIDKKIVKYVNQLFTDAIDVKVKESISNEMTKFVLSNYVKQLLESIDFKIIIKDTTLANGVREQGERFLFTKMNSYLLNEDKVSE